jgi:hypothetical protein
MGTLGLDWGSYSPSNTARGRAQRGLAGMEDFDAFRYKNDKDYRRLVDANPAYYGNAQGTAATQLGISAGGASAGAGGVGQYGAMSGIMDKLKGWQDQANAANEKRYQEILGDYGKQKDLVQSMGGQEAADITQRYQSAFGSGMQDLISRGLSGSTLLPSLKMGMAKRESADQGRLQDRLKANTLNVMQNEANFKERRTDSFDMGPYLQMLQQIGAGGYGMASPAGGGGGGGYAWGGSGNSQSQNTRVRGAIGQQYNDWSGSNGVYMPYQGLQGTYTNAPKATTMSSLPNIQTPWARMQQVTSNPDSGYQDTPEWWMSQGYN